MPSEIHAEPEIARALERLQEERRTGQRELGTLTEENARLQARLGQLQTEREQWSRMLQEVRQGKPLRRPRLPEVLAPPFEVRTQVPLRRVFLNQLPLVLVAGALLTLPWDFRTGFMLAFCVFYAVISVYPQLRHWFGRPSWRFTGTGLEDGGHSGLPAEIPYEQVVSATAEISPAQLRRGVGTVTVKFRPEPGAPEDFVSLLDVPEPERMAEWLQAKGMQAK
ncbi:hypothetical protein [Stigmatella aurantiaca]|uniref:DUF304 domain-containing protein n=1 Tax=Stigmatella aurantiaca (strain DW4/3-1) TaxID=378806 RepID=Q09DZ1_STIAD|nr:hypothetical protein [Stigmatella aurantiaca]ADO75170.1 uncharacterized protein STAUR_7414 [Stigmatella aurantiaca DW4/3-1]EAU69836.1 hypothetical protein STIAU_5534 [Stigmatella aurantiaca DW4/3-1]